MNLPKSQLDVADNEIRAILARLDAAQKGGELNIPACFSEATRAMAALAIAIDKIDKRTGGPEARAKDALA